MKTMVYVGNEFPQLKGKTAAVEHSLPYSRKVLAQFDDMGAPIGLAYGWTEFDKADFAEIDTEEGNTNDAKT